MITYNIRVSRPAPSMNRDKYVVNVADYTEAVEIAQTMWRKTRTRTTVHSGEFGVKTWHSISSKGQATDYNTGSGIPPFEMIS